MTLSVKSTPSHSSDILTNPVATQSPIQPAFWHISGIATAVQA